MRTTIQIIAFAVGIVFSFQSQAQTGDAIFPKGELSTTKNHTGNIWLKELNVGDSTFDPSIAVATYDAGGNVLAYSSGVVKFYSITEGTGYYQERGKAGTNRSQGRCDQMRSWSGALARRITEYLEHPTQKGKTVWLEPVSDKD